MTTNPNKLMSWLEKTSWLSLLIFCVTYAVFGWSVSAAADSWVQWVLENGRNVDWYLEQEFVNGIIHLLALVVIILISLFLTTPVALITIVFQESISSELKSFISAFLWCFILILMIGSWDYFAHLLVMVSAAILVKIDLQNLGCKTWQVFAIIVVLASLSFGFGIIIFEIKKELIVNHISS